MVAEIIELNDGNSGFLDALAPDVFDHPVDPTQLKNFIGDPRHVMMLAVEDGLVVGMASAVEYFHPDKQPQLWINEVGVSPAYRGALDGASRQHLWISQFSVAAPTLGLERT